jgi:hypothetical protein
MLVSVPPTSPAHVLNNLLKNQEMEPSLRHVLYMRRTELLCCSHRNLDDGTPILYPHRHLLFSPADAEEVRFVPAHPSFRLANPFRPTLVIYSTRPYARAFKCPS